MYVNMDLTMKMMEWMRRAALNDSLHLFRRKRL